MSIPPIKIPSSLKVRQCPTLTEVNTTNLQPIPVVSSHRGGGQKGGIIDEEVLYQVETNNNQPRSKNEQETSNKTKRRCSMCLRGDFMRTEEYFKHLKEHYAVLFKCKVCRLGFEEWRDVLRHIAKHHSSNLSQVEEHVSLPVSADRMLLAKCKLRKCRRQFVAMTGAELEQHFLMEHWRSRGKVAIGVEWNCRVCSNGGRRFRGWEEAVRHAEMHLAGLIVSAKDFESESDTSSGGFSSGDECLSSEDGESELSSVSERGTDDSEVGESEIGDK
eukprot:GFUD01037696.1.p1 GENE.GFUD01037696.1~~GFUD01037696.1.p1  ORF type:complete len:275 (+),score=83.75 GFUD01037696.1:67-891(+)